MSGAASGPIDYYWASCSAGNLPELSAKGAAQSTLSSAAGLVAGAALARGASRDGTLGLAAAGYAVLTVAHMLANAALLRCVRFGFPNAGRLAVMVEDFARGKGVPEPARVARKEALVFGWGGAGEIRVGGAEAATGNWR